MPRAVYAARRGDHEHRAIRVSGIHFITTRAGDALTLVDAGYPGNFGDVVTYIREIGHDPSRPRWRSWRPARPSWTSCFARPAGGWAARPARQWVRASKWSTRSRGAGRGRTPVVTAYEPHRRDADSPTELSPER
jgi:hypothetical protein